MDEDYLPDDTNGHCYYRMPSLTFSDAVSLCRTRKSDLAAVTSRQIRADLEFLMDSARLYTIWIGGTSRRWVWKQHDNLFDYG